MTVQTVYSEIKSCTFLEIIYQAFLELDIKTNVLKWFYEINLQRKKILVFLNLHEHLDFFEIFYYFLTAGMSQMVLNRNIKVGICICSGTDTSRLLLMFCRPLQHQLAIMEFFFNFFSNFSCMFPNPSIFFQFEF